MCIFILALKLVNRFLLRAEGLTTFDISLLVVNVLICGISVVKLDMIRYD